MLSCITFDQFLDWLEFEDKEMWPDRRMDWGVAHIVQAIINPERPLASFMLPFGDSRDKTEAPKQTVEFQTRVIDTWIRTSNARFAELNKKGKANG